MQTPLIKQHPLTRLSRAALLSGILLLTNHAIGGDRFGTFFQIIYYIANPVLIAGFFLFAASMAAICKNRNDACLALALSVTSACVWWGDIWSPTAAPGLPPTSRIVSWNTYGVKKHHKESIPSELHDLSPDMVVIVEGGRKKDKWWTRHFPSMHVLQPGHGIVLLSNTPMTLHAVEVLDNSHRIASVTTTLDHQEVMLVVVDVTSNFRRNRTGIIASILAHIDNLPMEYPVILAGDFNSPTDAHGLRPLHLRYTHAFTSSGSGYGATWPQPFPFVQIDQLWLDKRLTPARTYIHSAHGSDHRIVVCDLVTEG